MVIILHPLLFGQDVVILSSLVVSLTAKRQLLKLTLQGLGFRVLGDKAFFGVQTCQALGLRADG